MSHAFLFNARVWAFLQRIDEDWAAQCRAAGCPYCGGKLHSASYPRKPRGIPRALLGDTRRLSFCCAEQGCRRRTMAPSVRFFGRRVYLGAIFVFVTAMSQGARPVSIRERFGVGERTLERWRRWWRETFVETPLWQSLRGRFVPPLDASILPASLLARLRGGTHRARLLRALVLLSPLSRPVTMNEVRRLSAEDVSFLMF